ncbi:MAG: hypothetical protein BWY59_01021 [Verrucomicrobia bacterium ADurb.Bin345]|nr:MAG: hypothetical protein BWY59_01021 [Verrucomicrobia bacterium ADurb.Bin345]
MMRRRSLWFWVLLLAAMAAGIWWLFHVPYAPGLLFKAIPAEAAFVTQHRKLAERWDDIYRNPLAMSLFMSAGVKPSALRDLAEDPEARAWFEKLASTDTTLAYIPAMGPDREPVWVLASWLGGRSQRLRWNLGWHRIEGFTRGPSHRGRTYWIVDSRMLSSENTLTLALVEGMLIGCISWRHETMRDVLDTFDGIRPSLFERPGFPVQAAWRDDTETPDRGWLDAASLMGWRTPAAQAFAYEFSALTPTTLVGQLRWERHEDVAAGGWDVSRQQGLSAVLGDTPIALALVSPDWLDTVSGGKNVDAWLLMAREFISEQGADVVALAMLGGDYGGSLKGIRVPSVLLGIPLKNPASVPARVQRILDRLNARHRWGLIPHRLEAGAGDVVVFEGTAGTLYSNLPLEEKPAYAVVGDWMLLSSNAEALSNLVRRQKTGGGARPCWELDPAFAATPLYVWTDVVRGAKTLRLAISAYSLKLLVEDAQKTMMQRQRLNEVKAWIDALEPLGQCAIRAEPRSEDVLVHFRLGRICDE